MKLTKIEKELGKVIRYSELVDKINQIIDVLNKSFITDESDTIHIPHDTAFVTGLSIDERSANETN